MAYYFHWPQAEVLALPHRDRQMWCRQISAINRLQSGAPSNPFEVGEGFR